MFTFIDRSHLFSHVMSPAPAQPEENFSRHMAPAPPAQAPIAQIAPPVPPPPMDPYGYYDGYGYG